VGVLVLVLVGVALGLEVAVALGSKVDVAVGSAVDCVAQPAKRTAVKKIKIRRWNFIIFSKIGKFYQRSTRLSFNYKEQCNPEIHSKLQGGYHGNNKAHRRHNKCERNNNVHRKGGTRIRNIRPCLDPGNRWRDGR